MGLILSIETATAAASVALHRRGNLLSTLSLISDQTAAGHLSVIIDQIFKDENIHPEDLDAVAVSAGPGSYTGLRIGASTAKGICLGLNIPLIGIDSLHLIAEASVHEEKTDLLCPMMDARRMEVYYCLMDTAHQVLEDSQPKVIEEGSFVEYLSDRTILFAGPGVDKCRSLLQHANARFAGHIQLSAVHMGDLAYRMFMGSQFENLAQFEPRYLKEFAVKTKMVK